MSTKGGVFLEALKNFLSLSQSWMMVVSFLLVGLGIFTALTPFGSTSVSSLLVRFLL